MTDILTQEQIAWARHRASMKDELAKIVIDVVKICDSHEALRAKGSASAAQALVIAELRQVIKRWLENASMLEAGSKGEHSDNDPVALLLRIQAEDLTRLLETHGLCEQEAGQ